jgi:hypothetical protein
MSRSLPERPNLEQLRKQAKDLLKAQRQGDASVCPVLRHLPRFAGSSDEDVLKARLSLSEAQHALAREYGFKNWAALMRRVRKGPPPGKEWTFTEASVAAGARFIAHRPGTPFIPTIRVESGCRCRLCDNIATVHVTDRSEGKMVAQHYCARHAEENVYVMKDSLSIWRIADDRTLLYPVKYTVPLSLTPDQIQRGEAIPVTLPDGSMVKVSIPWGVMDGSEIIAGPAPGAAEKYCVRFVLKLIRPPAQR